MGLDDLDENGVEPMCTTCQHPESFNDSSGFGCTFSDCKCKTFVQIAYWGNQK